MVRFLPLFGAVPLVLGLALRLQSQGCVLLGSRFVSRGLQQWSLKSFYGRPFLSSTHSVSLTPESVSPNVYRATAYDTGQALKKLTKTIEVILHCLILTLLRMDMFPLHHLYNPQLAEQVLRCFELQAHGIAVAMPCISMSSVPSPTSPRSAK